MTKANQTKRRRDKLAKRHFARLTRAEKAWLAEEEVRSFYAAGRGLTRSCDAKIGA